MQWNRDDDEEEEDEGTEGDESGSESCWRG